MKVYDYDVDGSRHCREGVATQDRPGVFLDTFWGGSGDRHRLNATEVLTLRERFDTDDFVELARDGYGSAARAQWQTFAPEDRESVSSQHGLQVRYFVRRGASPDLATQIENAQQKVAEAERALESATSRLHWAKDELRALATLSSAQQPH